MLSEKSLTVKFIFCTTTVFISIAVAYFVMHFCGTLYCCAVITFAQGRCVIPDYPEFICSLICYNNNNNLICIAPYGHDFRGAEAGLHKTLRADLAEIFREG